MCPNFGHDLKALLSIVAEIQRNPLLENMLALYQKAITNNNNQWSAGFLYVPISDWHGLRTLLSVVAEIQTNPLHVPASLFRRWFWLSWFFLAVAAAAAALRRCSAVSCRGVWAVLNHYFATAGGAIFFPFLRAPVGELSTARYKQRS